MESETEVSTEALAAAKRRRVELKSAVSSVESAAAAPAASAGWADDLVRELEELREAFDQHVEEVEGRDGLLAEVVTTAPRLANKVKQVEAEHPPLIEQIARTIDEVRASADPERSRVVVLEALAAVARHRQRGADLVYEAYSVDIGGG